MAIEWSKVKAVRIPEGDCKRVAINGTIVWEKGGLPSEYQQVEYIEGDGAQYIDLNLSITRASVGYCRFYFSGSGSVNRFLFGGRTSGIENNVEFNRNTIQSFSFDYGSYLVNRIIIHVPVSAWHELNFTNNAITVDENEYQLTTVSDFSTPKTYLFDSYGKPTGTGWIGRVSAFRLEGQCDLVPCYRKSDGKIGMYDLVNGVFYTNSGRGTFIKGEDV